MARLIDADALLKYVQSQTRQIPAKEYDNDGFYHYSGWNGACVMARCAIKNAPTVEAAPVVRSAWDTVFYERNGTLASYSHICPECKYFYRDVRFKGHDFCPNCGAKMDGGVDNASGKPR